MFDPNVLAFSNTYSQIAASSRAHKRRARNKQQQHQQQNQQQYSPPATSPPPLPPPSRNPPLPLLSKTFDDLFPPLPSDPPPPPPLPQQQQTVQQTGMQPRVQPRVFSASSLEREFERCAKQSNGVFLKPEDFDFEKTTIKTFLDWYEKKIYYLPTYVASELGFDDWLYDLRRAHPPTSDQAHCLKQRIAELAYRSPYALHEAVETRTLKQYLGKDFYWIQTNVDW